MKLEQLTETLIDIESVTGNEQEILTLLDYLNKNKFTGEIIKNDGGLIAYHSKQILKLSSWSCDTVLLMIRKAI